jgi:activator of HSP90 ATPase
MILNIFCGKARLGESKAQGEAEMAKDKVIMVERRHLILGGLLSLVPLAAGRAAEIIPGAIRQQADFTVAPLRVYQALTDEKQFAAMSGAPAKIENREGGAFSLFGGAIIGRNLELVEGKRVVQDWRDAAWAAGLHSVIRFELTATAKGTHLSFDQAGYPESDRASLVAGWKSHYWEPMKAYFRKG